MGSSSIDIIAHNSQTSIWELWLLFAAWKKEYQCSLLGWHLNKKKGEVIYDKEHNCDMYRNDIKKCYMTDLYLILQTRLPTRKGDV